MKCCFPVWVLYDSVSAQDVRIPKAHLIFLKASEPKPQVQADGWILLAKVYLYVCQSVYAVCLHIQMCVCMCYNTVRL